MNIKALRSRKFYLGKISEHLLTLLNADNHPTSASRREGIRKVTPRVSVYEDFSFTLAKMGDDINGEVIQ
jgi:hypothetical protein